MPKKVTYFNYLKKSFCWLLGNFAFGLGPLLLMGIVYIVSEHKYGFDDIMKLIHEGAILFVCCAMMGSVLVDFLLAGYRLRGSEVFATFIFPFALLAIVALEYLFIILKIINTDCFNIFSGNSIFVVGCSFGYCLLIKTNLLIKEDTSHE